MNKYQEALNTLESFSRQYISERSFSDEYEEKQIERIEEKLNLLQGLVDKEIELQSRKDKLIVGSEWECVADCYSKHFIYDVGDIVSVVDIKNNHIELKHYAIRDDVIKDRKSVV